MRQVVKKTKVKKVNPRFAQQPSAASSASNGAEVADPPTAAVAGVSLADAPDALAAAPRSS